MTLDWRESLFHEILDSISKGSPRNLIDRAQPDATENHSRAVTVEDLLATVRDASPESGFLNALGIQVHKWDAADESGDDWTSGTERFTFERRALVAKRLGLDTVGAAALLKRRPIFKGGTVVVTAPWHHWYTDARAAEHAFYWPLYKSYLTEVRNWPPENVAALDLATNDVIKRLAEPTRTEAHQSKGLVVGYVQSGKTANFTGVVAKAIDAGYRLIVVMTGTIEMLRGQTQRRLDMEMIGQQNILGDSTEAQAAAANADYRDDDGWPDKFLNLGQDEPLTEIRRLTQHHRDYSRQFKTLKIDRVEKTLHLYDPPNLYRSAARVAVVKKNAFVLKKLVEDIQHNSKAFAEIPVLIIDDESDQASVNTIDPDRARKPESSSTAAVDESDDGARSAPDVVRRKVNGHIAAMLKLMPRAQYVGYTATPFANVFVDPSDPVGIFPKDFVIGLDRPPGYMGVDDFHDLNMDPELTGPPTVANSNRLARVRSLDALDGDELRQREETASAIDMFVLTGAVKLYRRSIDSSLDFRHHTMLIHESMKTIMQKAAALRVASIWADAGFNTPDGQTRLRSLYNSDVLPVSKVRVELGVPEAPDFDLVASFIPTVLAKVNENGNDPLIVVNSDAAAQAEHKRLDFDKEEVWKILIGGAKLSRGFTVEGLTVSYFRRATNMSDSLTQMGRWFGFRHGYLDLVRLYIARNAKFQTGTVDLYEAFEGIAVDEIAFRDQLVRYAQWDGDNPKLLPSQIPPLVTQHLPWLRPTARDKMFNARLVRQSEQPVRPVAYPDTTPALLANLELWTPIIAGASTKVVVSPGAQSFDAYVGVLEANTIIDAIENAKYLDLYRERYILPRMEFYKSLVKSGHLTSFVVVMPQLQAGQLLDIGGAPRRVAERSRRPFRGGLFSEITEPDHRAAAERFVGEKPYHAGVLEQFAAPERGVVLLYLIREIKNKNDTLAKPIADGHIVGFSSYVPKLALPVIDDLVFQVRNKEKSGDATTDVI